MTVVHRFVALIDFHTLNAEWLKLFAFEFKMPYTKLPFNIFLKETYANVAIFLILKYCQLVLYSLYLNNLVCEKLTPIFSYEKLNILNHFLLSNFTNGTPYHTAAPMFQLEAN